MLDMLFMGEMSLRDIMGVIHWLKVENKKSTHTLTERE